jgi:hypothetical protein
MNSNPITGITLEGFQVFDKPTYIPLNRLTLLFGPNSAGKSAVQDAIELYAALMSKDDAGSYKWRYAAEELLERHWRRTGGNDDLWVDHLALGVFHTTQCDIHDSVGGQLDRKTWGEFLAVNGHAWELECRWNFERYDSPDEGLSFKTCFEFYVESALVARDTPDELLVNLAHPLLSQTELNVDFTEVAKAYPQEVTLKDGHLTVRGCFLGFHPMGPNSNDHNDSWLRYYSTVGNAHASKDRKSLFFAALIELNLLLGCVLRTANGNSRFKPTTVNASRMVPTRQELTFQVGNLHDPMQPNLSEENKIYKTLAKSLTSELTNSQTKYPSPEDRQKYADAVNRALADHLFIDQGYRLDYDFRLLLSKTNSQAAISEFELDSSEFGFLVELFLRDGNGRKHFFEDVGSGIGYLLPVLCAVFERAGDDSTCFVQQPELHIHPALQTAMGDVFIEGSEEDRQILIETHSEHLLLRILKRIRQTHLQATIAPELKIEADDVCVLYFDPSPAGTTTVKRLRITEDGEFMDRWPRGFFGERDQELLDE